ncbi:cuticle protein 10.9-like [Dermacentor andersoni]|uniref:cuticle protein 10.9-like n=1 Tax=Dermacentor andersoni TaxID=34620 RepID=UPI002155034A|nr:cuticle protein 10.9-like [Dermacentor andersoni]
MAIKTPPSPSTDHIFLLHPADWTQGARSTMLCKVVFLALVAFAAAQVQLQEQFPPHPYTFSYESTGEDGGRISQQETGDERNFKTGSYSYQTPDGVYRTANYVADDNGFRVSIDTNEPGTKAENPADVTLNANPIEVPATYTFGKSKS